MQSSKLAAISRDRLGKGGARETRRQAMVPVVVYGKGQETRHFAVKAHDLGLTIDHHARILELEVEGGSSVNGLIRDIQRHPVTDEILHMDLLLVSDEDVVRTELPIRLKGSPVGVKQGGQVRSLLHRVTVDCKVADLPTFFEVDVTTLQAGRNLLVKDIKREGLRVLNPDHVAVVQITKPRVSTT